MSSAETQTSHSQDIKTASSSSSNSNTKKRELSTRNSSNKVKPGGSAAAAGVQEQVQHDGVASTSSNNGSSNSTDEAERQKKEKVRLKKLAKKQKMKADKAKSKVTEESVQKQPDTVNVQLPIPKDLQSSKASGSASSRAADTAPSSSKQQPKQAAPTESDGEGETWTAGEDEDDSRPRLSSVKSDKQPEATVSKTQLKKQKQKKKQELKDQVNQKGVIPLQQQPPKSTLKTDKPAAVNGKLPPETSTAAKIAPASNLPLPPLKSGKRQNLTIPREQKMFVPPAFAATAPPPSDLLECYNEPDSRAITKFSKDGNHKTQMHLRVSLRPLPKMQTLPSSSTQRQQYKKSMGVVEVDLVVQSRKNKDLPSNVKVPQVYSRDREPVIVGYQSRQEKERQPADLETIVQQNSAAAIVRPSSAPPVASSVVSLSDHLAGSLSLSGSSVASTSISTPPLPSKAEETTFYTSSPALEAQDSAIINFGRRLEAEEKPSFIPASTAVISAPPLPSVSQQQQHTASISSSREDVQDHQQPPTAALVAHTAYHAHQPQLYRPMPPYGPGMPYEQPAYYGHGSSQPFQAADGTYWQLNAYGQAVPFYGYSAGPMYGPALQQPYFYQQPHNNYQVVPNGNSAVHHLADSMRSAQPYDSPPYSPHDSFSSPVQHQHTGRSAVILQSTSVGKSLHNPAVYPVQGFHPATSSSSSSSSAVASHQQQYSTQQPHPLSLPPQMPSPIYPYPSQGSGYTYDPETGLMTDETGLVFPPQHQPMMQSYHGPVRPLSEFHASASDTPSH